MFRKTQPEQLIQALGAALWLRADAGVVNGNHWVNQTEPGLIATPLGDPTFDPTGFNGRQTFLFDGVGDAFQIINPFGTSFLEECTLVVATITNAFAIAPLFVVNDGTIDNMLRVQVDTGTVIFETSAGGVSETNVSGGGFFPPSTPILFSVRWGGGTITYRSHRLGGINTDTDAHTQAVGAVDRTTVGGGPANEWDGAISEIVYFNADIGDSNVVLVENELINRWGPF